MISPTQVELDRSLSSSTFSRLTHPGILTVLVMSMGLVPLWVGTPAFFIDWPNHLARVWILHELENGNTYWTIFYQQPQFYIPNDALDLTILSLMRTGMSLDLSAHLFLSIALISFVGGLCLIAHSVDALDRAKPFLAVLMFYGGPLMFGLVNYVAGVGIMFVALGLWLRAKRSIGALPLAAVAVAILFFCHVIAAGLFVFIIGALTMWDCFFADNVERESKMNQIIAATVSTLVLLAMFALSPTAASTGQHSAGLIHFAGHNIFQIVRWKIEIFARSLFDGPGMLAAAFYAFCLACISLLVIARGKVRLRRDMLFLTLLFVFLSVALPQRIGNGSLLDYRVAFLPVCLAIAASQVTWKTKYAPHLAIVLVLAATAARTTAVSLQNWRNTELTSVFDRTAQTFPSRQSVLLISPGQNLDEVPWWTYWDQPVKFLATHAVEHEVFVPAVYANPNQQPLALRPEFADFYLGVQPYSNRTAFGDAVSRVCRMAGLNPLLKNVFLFVYFPSPASVPSLIGYPIVARNDSFEVVRLC